MKIKSFECPKSIKIIRKIILGTSDSWSTIRLSHRPSNPALYIVDWRIFGIEILNYVNVTATFQDSSFASISVINWKDGSEGHSNNSNLHYYCFPFKKWRHSIQGCFRVNLWRHRKESGIPQSIKTKGQTKSKWFFQANVSSKKRTKEFNFTILWDFFSFVFWRKLKTPKRHFEIN